MRDDVLDPLTALVEKSWVTYSYEEQAGEGRYRLLETVRQYAHDRLLEAGEGPTVRGRHLSCFLRLVQEAEPRLRGGEQAAWLDRLEREHDNLHAAIEWSLEAEEGWQEGLALTRDLFQYWDLRHRFGGALGYLKRFAERSAELPIDERANVFHLAGLVAMKQADYPAARRYFEESRSLRRQQEVLEDPRQLQGLGALALHEGDYVQAAALLQESLSLFRDVKAKHSSVWVLSSLAWIGCHEGEHATARAHLVEALALCRETGRYGETIDTLVSVGHLAQRQDQPARAMCLFGAAEALRAVIGEAMPPVERPEYEGAITAARAALGEEAFASAWAEGRAMTRDQAVRFALEEIDV